MIQGNRACLKRKNKNKIGKKYRENISEEDKHKKEHM